MSNLKVYKQEKHNCYLIKVNGLNDTEWETKEEVMERLDKISEYVMPDKIEIIKVERYYNKL